MTLIPEWREDMNKDYAEKEYLEDSQIFTDLLNGFIYEGKPVIKADQLRSIDPVKHIPFIDQNGDEKLKERIADLSKDLTLKTDGKQIYAVINVQNQTKTDYGMPLRNLILEVMEYMKQAQKITEAYARKEKKKVSFTSDLQPSDQINGVISLTVLFSSENWDGPQSFEEMIDAPEDLKEFMIRYPLNLIVPAEMSEQEILKRYCGDLGLVFLYLKCCGGKEELKALMDRHKLLYEGMTLKSAELIRFITGDDFLYNEIIRRHENRRESPDMSEGMRQLLEEARENGVRAGKQELTRDLILKISQKGKTPEEIADLLEMDINEVLEMLKQMPSDLQ